MRIAFNLSRDYEEVDRLNMILNFTLAASPGILAVARLSEPFVFNALLSKCKRKDIRTKRYCEAALCSLTNSSMNKVFTSVILQGISKFTRQADSDTIKLEYLELKDKRLLDFQEVETSIMPRSSLNSENENLLKP